MNQPFAVRTVLAMVLVGVFTFAAFIVLSTYAPELRSGRDGRGHVLSRSAVGFAALSRLATDTGMDVRIDRGRGAGADAAEGLRILTPEAGADPKAFRQLVADKDAGVTLVVLPKWAVGPDPRHPGWVSRLGLVEAPAVTAMFDKGQALAVTRRKGTVPGRLYDIEEPGGDDIPPDVGPIDSLQVFTPSSYTPVVTDMATGAPVLVRAPGNAGLFVLSDPDLLNTQGLANPARAHMAMRVLQALRGEGPVVFDVSINGFAASPSLLKLALEPPFLAGTLCALAAALLMGWHAAARFGAPARTARALALGKSALADNSAALLRLAKREHRMAAPYADMTVQTVARAVGTPRGLDPDQTLALLDRLSLKAEAPNAPSALLAEAAAVRDPAGLLRVARRLHDWRRRMTRERA